MTLADAIDAAERADWSACLSALLAAWRQTSLPALADLIDRVSGKVVAPAVTPRAAAIKKRIEAASDSDVGALLDMLLREVRTSPGMYGYVVELAHRRPRDPRIARAVAALIALPSFTATTGAPYKDLIEALDAIDDPRFRQLLVDEWRRLEPQRLRIRKHREGFELLGRLAEAVRRRPAPPPLPGVATAIKRIDAALARTTARRRAESRSASELLAAIYDDPHDTALRLVYADALQIAGDPRGEFIALQCARGDGPISRRERELLAAYGRVWLGAIEPIVLRQGLVYRRGFPTCVRESRELLSHRPLLDAIEWRTVEELELRESADLAIKFLADRRKPLVRVWQLYGEDLLDLVAQEDLLPWRTLGLRSALSSEWQDIAKLTALPNLVELDLTEVHGPVFVLRALAGGPLVRRLRRLRLSTRHYRVADLLVAGRSIAPEVELVHEYTFPGAPQGEAVRFAGNRLTLVHHRTRLDASYAIDIIAQLPVDSLREVTLEAPPHARVDQPSWNQLGALLAAHGLAAPLP
ncbi:MAG TPA: TIGR02996 domain-containing protein [Kofleriaceae bacterium]|nr:TIGR02996 domain-containing protein [Kofleriaceae bacterium]